MAETGPFEALMPEVTIEELFAAQGADLSKRSPKQEMVDLNRKLLEEAKGFARVRIIWQEVKVIGSGKQELYLEDGLTFKGSLLPKVLGSADGVVLFAMTIGETIDERVKDYTHRGKTLEAFILDAAGSAIMAKAAYHSISEIERLYKEKQLDTTFSLGPGHSYWKGLEDVRSIIDYLKGERIGISLTDSNLMLPKKSIAMVMGVGSNLPDFKGKIHCDFCHLKGNCTMRELGSNNC
ncbi:vitamin B12 dependent methionine synthase [Desulfitobacterium dehalogenans ATCC 51507]|uniref:Vitamin B12 dependent methionine synthase n=1 Tax=Desulfitobacterium dehalogenans (strain ATCC 51507 / DSM 9161 / JW/IU-DC1) TaxID=756499 RepID=I4ACC9_DESDJ|nr:vitamin B12 dependent-methionine synthase activation domain-containing protein [Desulfitobacterium dehalogenans]AFM01614.1 vitamin B12 dependent methionine synthase [Desulfitobacterium dehalogenans ATCC 51507]